MVPLLPFVRADHFLAFLFHRLQVETCGRLHRGIRDRRVREFHHLFLHHHKAPELAPIKVIKKSRGGIIQRFSPNRRRSLERVLPNVHYERHIGSRFLSRPAPWLLEENKLEVVDANRSQVRPTEVPQLVTLRWPAPLEKSALVVTVKVVLIGSVRSEERRVGKE